jgi:transcriptional regulator with XRE-family HTH domain
VPVSGQTFGQRVAYMRNLRGLSQHQLADRVPLSRSSIANIEAGRQECTLKHLRELAAGLGVTSGQLLGEVPLPEAPEVYITVVRYVDCVECGRIADDVTAEGADTLRRQHIERHLRGDA